jgi:hypothetical protein
VTKKVRANFDGAISFYTNKLAAGPKGEQLPVWQTMQKTKITSRAAYLVGQKIINIPPRDVIDDEVAVHEIAHLIEDQIPGVLEASLEFLKHRVQNEPLTPMNRVGRGYGRHEMGRKNHFDRAFSLKAAYYIGKDYGGKASEIFSMGVELLARDPIHFAKKDPEYFKFVVGLLTGESRHQPIPT